MTSNIQSLCHLIEQYFGHPFTYIHSKSQLGVVANYIFGSKREWSDTLTEYQHNDKLVLHEDREHRGLLLLGSYGIGKTMVARTIFRLANDKRKGSMKFFPMSELADVDQDTAKGKIERVFSQTDGVVLDDVGIEKDKSLFPRIVDANEGFGHPNTRLFITSNFPAADLSRIYGARTTDRLRSQVMQIILEGSSFRK